MQHLPLSTYVIFGSTVLIAAALLFKATHYSKPFLAVLLGWLAVQGALGTAGFYNDPSTMTARFPLLFLPPLLFTVYRFATKRGRAFIDSLDLATLTLLHTVRLLVEVVLLAFWVHKAIPQAMTFHGRNFDIFSGITAPLVYYFGFVRKTLSPKIILLWNFICLGLLINVVATALLSLPGRYQTFGFEQPNIGLGFFPFVWLPSFLVPAVLFSMLVAIRQLMKKR